MDEQLFNDRKSSVTPSWLINGKSRYAIRTVARLEFSTLTQPRSGIVLMLCLGAGLVAFSLYYLLQGATPRIIPIIMLFASLTLVVGFALALYRIKPLHRVKVVMLDGSNVVLSRKKKSVALELLEGLTDAMDWHRIGSIEIDAQRASHLRQEVAQGTLQAKASGKAQTKAPGEVQAKAQGITHEKAQEKARQNPPPSTAGKTLLRWLNRIRQADVRSSSAARPMSAESTTARAQGLQKRYAGAGPVVAMKEVTVSGRLKMFFTRVSRWFSR